MGKLIINEWVKIFRRPGTYVMIGMVILFILGFAGISKYGELNTAPVDNANWKENLITQIENDKQTLSRNGNTNSNYQMYLEREIAIKEYQLENELAPQLEVHVWSFVNNAQAAISIAGLFTIIIAAGIVASEFSWGTVKLLLIRPISRSKILLSKYLTVGLFGLLLLMIIYTLSALVGVLLFGLPSSEVPHLAYVNGEVVERNIALHLIGQYFLGSIDILMIATMAFMISAVFRNSSLAIGISLFLFFTGGTATMLLASKFEWTKYFLFANTNLSVYFDGVPPIEGMTLTFSIILLLIYFLVFHLLAFSVFRKRDVSA
ncbi:ABC transporter permease [Bacillus timonensis]|nr:ABC transporter permease [Bacillus timonensis]